MFHDRSKKKGLGTILLFKVMFPLIPCYVKGRYQDLSWRKVSLASNRLERLARWPCLFTNPLFSL